MPGDRVGNRVEPRRENLPSTSVVSPDQKRAGDDVKKLDFNDLLKDVTLMGSVLKWRGRAAAGANEDLDALTVLSTAFRHGRLRLRSRTNDKVFTPQQVGERLDKESNLLLSTVKNALPNGAVDKQNKSLFEAYKSAVLTLQQYAHGQGSATLQQAEARIRGFTNLKLFMTFGGDLHSRKGGDKLERTLAKIPEIVLQNASPDVTADDYGKADIQREGRWFQRQRPLLSFRGFKATNSWFGRGKDSRAYRENLRALTASALILGGVEKALRVKKLLTKINNCPAFEGCDTKEELVERALKNLATHGDPDALIDDLAYLEGRQELLQSTWSFVRGKYDIGDAKRAYLDFHDEVLKLDKASNRMTTMRNFVDQLNDPDSDYKVSNLHKNMRLVEYMSEEDPLRFILKYDISNKAKAVQEVAKHWVDLMIPQGTPGRQNLKDAIERAIGKINEIGFSKRRYKTHLHAARSFADIDKSKMSVWEQSMLLLSCLQQPLAAAHVQLAEVNSLNAVSNIEEDVKEDVKEDAADDNNDKKAVGNIAQEVKKDINQDAAAVNNDNAKKEDRKIAQKVKKGINEVAAKVDNDNAKVDRDRKYDIDPSGKTDHSNVPHASVDLPNLLRKDMGPLPDEAFSYDDNLNDWVYWKRRDRLLQATQTGFHQAHQADVAKRAYSDFRGQVLKLDKARNRMTILGNFMQNIADRRSGYDLKDPHRQLSILENMSHEDPIDFVLKSDTEDRAQAVRNVIEDWVDLMIPRGILERRNLERAIEEINNRKFSKTQDGTYLRAAQLFADIDKREMSVKEQAVLLLSCLQRPFAPAHVHLAKVGSLEADGNITQGVTKEINQVAADINNDKPNDDIDPSGKTGRSGVRHDPFRFQRRAFNDLEVLAESLADKEDSDSDVNDDFDDDIKVEESPKPQRPADNVTGNKVDNDIMDDDMGDGGMVEDRYDSDGSNEPENTAELKRDILIPDGPDTPGNPDTTKEEN